MAVTGFHVSSFWGWSENETASGTTDVEVSPSSVYATAMIDGLTVANNAFLWSGILEYRTRNPKTGKKTTHSVGNLNWSFSLADWIVDNNVDRITFAMGIWDTGGGNFSSRLDAVHQIWFFD
jgi:hypothetical protein